MRSRVTHKSRGFSSLRAAISGAERPTVLRTFSDTPREEGEAGVGVSWVSGRFAAQLSVTAIVDPDDDRKVRPDGSYIGVTLGNFMVSAGWMYRWWGPGGKASSLSRRTRDAFRASRWSATTLTHSEPAGCGGLGRGA